MPGHIESDGEHTLWHRFSRFFFFCVIQDPASFDGVAVVIVVIFQRYVPFAVIAFICCWRRQRAFPSIRHLSWISWQNISKPQHFVRVKRENACTNLCLGLELRAPRNGNSSANDYYYYRYYYSSFPFLPGRPVDGVVRTNVNSVVFFFCSRWRQFDALSYMRRMAY